MDLTWLKYQHDLTALPNCPPRTAAPSQREAYRFVREAINHPDNFLPPAKINPARTFDSDVLACAAHALSMFDTREHAVAFFKLKVIRYPNFANTIGTHLAKGDLTTADGVATNSNKHGHFDLFEANGVDLASRFEIIEALSNE